MASDGDTSAISWLTAKRSRSEPKLLALLALLGLVLIFLAIWILPDAIVDDPSTVGLDPEPKETLLLANEKTENDVRGTLLQGIAGGLFFLTAYFTWRQIQTTREGHTIERFGRSIDQLGGASVDVRLGGIYSLEAIGRNPAYNVAVAEIMSAYLQTHTAKAADAGPAPNEEPVVVMGTLPPHTAIVTISGPRRLEEEHSERSGASDAAAQLERGPLPVDVRAVLRLLVRETRSPTYRPVELDLSWVRIPGADLSKIQLPGAVIRNGDFTAAILSSADLRSASLAATSLRHARLTEAHLDGAIFVDTDASYVVAYDAVFAGIRGRDSQWSNADLRRADFTGADLTGASFNGAKLTNAVFVNAVLEGCNLVGATLGRARFRFAKLGGSDLRGVDLSQAELDEADLLGAKYDSNSRFPSGFNPVTAGLKSDAAE